MFQMDSESKIKKYSPNEKVSPSINKKLEQKKGLKIQPTQDSTHTLTMIKDLQKIIKNCTHLSEQQKWEYCKSQRYFIKHYLRSLHQKRDD